MAAAPSSDDDRYLVISADHHAGADVQEYKPYLEAQWHDEFDAWAAEVTDRWNAANEGRDNERSWHSARRLEEDDADGIAGEVLFPNTLPPFYPKNDLTSSLPRTREEYEQRFAGLRAHNRWAVDFIAQAPVRRRGPVQILLNDIDDALTEIRWGHEHGLTAVLIPAPSPNHPLEGLWSRRYDPIWALAEELGMPINQHSGAGAPEVGTDPAELACWQFDLRPYAHRTLSNLVYAGVFERYPNLRFIMTEEGVGWVRDFMDRFDQHFRRLSDPSTRFNLVFGQSVDQLTMLPSEYIKRNCYVTISGVVQIEEIETRHKIGSGHMMWGSDYPHDEGSFPHSREELRAFFSDVPVDECRAILGLTAGELYGFDVEKLNEVAQRIGPTVEEIHTPLERYPEGSTLHLFIGDLPEREKALTS